ncbi:MAG: ribbon-helix-helix domain-containing protein [Candidatus Bathyarchaeota archaeon]|nr:ribbon-helix-helix domain-containing protein [Candidatus Bathyarchaeota archaeon]
MESMPKEKVTITVEKRLLEWIDRQIENFRFRNRSHAFEYAIAKLIETEKEKGSQ